MTNDYEGAKQVQGLVLDILTITRNHQIPGTEEHENDVAHSFGVAMLAWWLHDKLQLDMDEAKLFKYALIHDFPERGVDKDTNTFASPLDRVVKIEREKREQQKLIEEFRNFEDFTTSLTEYENQTNEESLFVWTVDKMQAILLGSMDDWRPYKSAKPGGISRAEFDTKNNEILAKCSPYLHETFAGIIEHVSKDYYDQV